MKDKNFEIMNVLISYITQSDEWVYLQKHDPRILAAQKRWEVTIDKIRAEVTKPVINELEDAFTGYSAVCDDVAVLYGFRMAIALMDAMNRPLELSQYILGRTAVKKG